MDEVKDILKDCVQKIEQIFDDSSTSSTSGQNPHRDAAGQPLLE